MSEPNRPYELRLAEQALAAARSQYPGRAHEPDSMRAQAQLLLARAIMTLREGKR